MVAIDSLIPATYNPRKWDEPALERLIESIRKFGFIDPVIANGTPKRKNIVIGGHMRMEAAKRLGKTDVPTVYVNPPGSDSPGLAPFPSDTEAVEWTHESARA